MAWHDNGWDGRICRDPQANAYCVGSRSLLSDRLARERDLDKEIANAGKPLDSLLQEYLPPCFWSSGAFSLAKTEIIHWHPFPQFHETKSIHETLPSYSVFTWPFRLAFSHDDNRRRTEGQYPADLDSRIGGYFARFVPGKSIVFFYLNYDNPLTAESYAYALVGCARLKDIAKPQRFSFSPEELEKVRSGKEMQNFPTVNWAVRLSYDFPNSGILLPYHEYLRRLPDHPDLDEKLEEITVAVEEDALIPSFKYVSEEVDEDACLYLLYKLKRAVEATQKHGIVKFDREQALIEDYVKEAWKSRGLYPGLGGVIEALADPDGENPNSAQGQELAETILSRVKAGNGVDEAFSILGASSEIPSALKPFKRAISSARKNLKAHKSLAAVLRKLSLFNLTPFQVRRIIFPGAGNQHPFPRRKVAPNQIVDNPYLLCEEYEPLDRADLLDYQEIPDHPIGVFRIDIGMFPDARYLESDDDLQDLAPTDPRRLRALIAEYLSSLQHQGHCFAAGSEIADYVLSAPLFYREGLPFNDSELLEPESLAHFGELLHVEQRESESYFYLKGLKAAEDVVRRVIDSLLQRGDHKADKSWIAKYLAAESANLKKKAPQGFDEEKFTDERRQLLHGALSSSLFVVTGEPGSGKTFAIRAIAERLLAARESVLVLAPTGKAALRLKRDGGFAEAQTIDRYLARLGVLGVTDDLRQLNDMRRPEAAEIIHNLIVDESSMIDLSKLAVLCRLLELQKLPSLKRLILVGDENQLPPIGFGRPFHDVVAYLRANKTFREKRYVRLETNCRQTLDDKVLKAASVFTAGYRYYEQIVDELRKGGELSPGLKVGYWSSPAELKQLVNEEVRRTIKVGTKEKDPEKLAVAFNQLFGLYEGGYVPKDDSTRLTLDALQMLTPYRGGVAGTLAINQMIRGEYREVYRNEFKDAFTHADKLIRTSNWYRWDWKTKRKELYLPNGSIGVLCKNRIGWRAFFPEATGPIWWSGLDNKEDFELAYAITVHKSQGSEFDSVIVVVPERKALLSRELLYTAFTRSKGRLCLLVERKAGTATTDESPLETGRARSTVAMRNTSLFTAPSVARRALEPEPNVHVTSKIEYIIYRALQAARDGGRLSFGYEAPLKVKGCPVKIHPDFTVDAGGRRYYWEHLGMLDAKRYWSDWQQRRKWYEAEKLEESLVTTDDLDGIREERLKEVIDSMVSGKLPKGENNDFSRHHYRLM